MGESARATDVWLRSYPFWEGYFALAWVITVAIVVIDAPTGTHAAITVALLLSTAIGYLLFGRQAIRRVDEPTRATWLHVAGTLLFFLPATFVLPAAAFGLSAVIPQAYMALRPPLAAALTVILLSGSAYHLLLSGGAGPILAGLVLVLLAGCSLLLGVLIDRQGRQNVERAKLIAELDRTRDELAEMSRQAGALAERERLARDIHDTVAQGLGGISMLLQAEQADSGPSRNLTLARDAAQDSLAEVRALVAALSPPALTDGSLAAVLTRLAERADPQAELIVTGTPRTLEASFEAVLLRITQEALANVGKHASADTVRVTLDYLPDRVRLAVADDGVGVDHDHVPTADAGGFGLRGMRDRVGQAGGTFAVDSTPGRGTSISAELPCPG